MTSAEPTPYLTTQHGEHYATLGLGVLWLVMPRINANAQEQNGERAAKSAEMWISPDPARQFASPYAYGPNPVNSVDPDGMVDVSISGGGHAAMVYGFGFEGEHSWNLNAMAKKYSDNQFKEGNRGNGLVFGAISKSLDLFDAVATFGNVTNRSQDPIYSGGFKSRLSMGIQAGATTDLTFKLTLGKGGDAEVGGLGGLALHVGGHIEATANFDEGIGFTGLSLGAGPSLGEYVGGALLLSHPPGPTE